MFLEIYTPDKKAYSGEVSIVTVPGTDGSFQVLNNHAPLISTLQAGKLRLVDSEGEKIFTVSGGGVVEVLKNKVVLLAEGLN